MKTTKKIILTAVLAAASLLMIGCGEEDPTLDAPQVTSQVCQDQFGQAISCQSGSYQQSSYTEVRFFGHSGFDCNGAVPTVANTGVYSNVGAFLTDNPESVVTYNNRCYRGRELYDMYSQHYGNRGDQTPWDFFFSSPYGGFDIGYNNQNNGFFGNGYFGQNSSGSFDYTNTTTIHQDWNGMNGGYPGWGQQPQQDQWYFRGYIDLDAFGSFFE